MDASSELYEFEAIEVSSIMHITKVEIFFVEGNQVVGKLKFCLELPWSEDNWFSFLTLQWVFLLILAIFP